MENSKPLGFQDQPSVFSSPHRGPFTKKWIGLAYVGVPILILASILGIVLFFSILKTKRSATSTPTDSKFLQSPSYTGTQIASIKGLSSGRQIGTVTREINPVSIFWNINVDIGKDPRLPENTFLTAWAGISLDKEAMTKLGIMTQQDDGTYKLEVKEPLEVKKISFNEFKNFVTVSIESTNDLIIETVVASGEFKEPKK